MCVNGSTTILIPCLEQVSSIAVGLSSPEKWNAIVKQLPAYLDQDGLAMYFPSAVLNGDVVLTAYLISMADEAQKQGEWLMAFLQPTGIVCLMACSIMYWASWPHAGFQ